MEFSPMMGNSALMQSYNLMKMSSEVTKPHNTPQFANHEKPNEYFQQKQNQQQMYQPQQQMNSQQQQQMMNPQQQQMNPHQQMNSQQQQRDYSRGMYQKQNNPSHPPLEKNSSDNFLCKIFFVI